MKRVLYFCLLLLSWAPHARGVQPGTASRATRLRTLEGVVMDVQSLPLSDATVRLWADAERRTLVLEEKTNADGKFMLANVKRGTYFIEFLAPGFNPYLTEIRVSNVSSTAGFVFSPLRSSAAHHGGNLAVDVSQ